jgi:hypothetical protein
MTLLCFRVVCPKLSILGKIANDHLEIFHEGFEKDSHGRVMIEEGLLNQNPLRNRRSDAYESVCKHLNFWEGFGKKKIGKVLGKLLVPCM